MGKIPSCYLPSLGDIYLKIWFVAHGPIGQFFWYVTFWRSALGLLLIFPMHIFFRSWHFVLVFPFLQTSLPVSCSTMQNPMLGSEILSSLLGWAGPGLSALLTGLGSSLDVTGFAPGTPCWASFEGTLALNHVLTCSLSSFGVPLTPRCYPHHPRHVKAFSGGW